MYFYFLGDGLISRQNYHKAIDYFIYARNIWSEVSDENIKEFSDNESYLGVCYQRIGDFQRALKFKESAKNLRVEYYGNQGLEVSQSWSNLGVTYHSLD